MSRTITPPRTAPRGERAERIREERRQVGVRILAIAALLVGINYIGWRWLFSLNEDALWIAIPLILAETFSFLEVALYVMTAWRAKPRGAAPTAPAGLTVDVFIATVDESVDLVLRTVQGAKSIAYPCTVWVLDDGDRPEMREAVLAAGVGYLSRGSEWDGYNRHAKAGNLNSAIMATEGEFILVLDADQVPAPTILHRTLGYFDDPMVAFVQTPQSFSNVPDGDPFGSSAPLFYGPIMQGKDGWNAAFFCGSNAVLRREALMQLAISRYVRDVERNVRRELDRADGVILRALESDSGRDPVLSAALTAIGEALRKTRAAVRRGEPLARATFELQQTVASVSRDIVAIQLHSTAMDLASLTEADLQSVTSADVTAFDFGSAIGELAEGERSPLAALVEVRELLKAVDLDLSSEAQPLMPLATNSVTEDMATAMRLHASGWRSVYSSEILAEGLAPEDLGTMLKQRLRWAQGTMQVAFRENPLVQRGLSLGQRLMYFATIWGHLSGFAAVAYFAAPIVFLVGGILPLTADPADFLIRFLPFLALNTVFFLVASRGVPALHARRYAVALFPVWIRATLTAAASVLFRRPLEFVVTRKTRPAGRAQLRLVWPQLLVAVVLVVAAALGVARVMAGEADVLGTVANLIWVGFDLAALSVLVGALRHRGSPPEPRGT